MDRINNQQDSKEKCIIPAQPQPNPKGQPQGDLQTFSPSEYEQVKAITVLRSDKVIGQEIATPRDEIEFVRKDNEF